MRILIFDNLSITLKLTEAIVDICFIKGYSEDLKHWHGLSFIISLFTWLLSFFAL